jgi:hypothetical protein
MPKKIISGGQTGVDRAALDVCMERNFPCSGWCPKGRLAEDGVINREYPLTETNEAEYSFRTIKNVIDSDGTIIISPENLSGGTQFTYQTAIERQKPVLAIHPTNQINSSLFSEVKDWLRTNKIEILNIAGPRESEWPEGYKITHEIVSGILRLIQ